MNAASAKAMSLVALALGACAGADARPLPKDGGAQADDLAAAVRALHEAPPHRWEEHLAAVHRAGERAEPLLIAELTRAPAAPGAQASLALLGALGGDAGRRFCLDLVEERAPLAVDAALALHELPGSADDPVLRAAVADRHADPALRTAAACALARHGDREVAPAFLEAVVRVGSPAGRADERRHGLPAKARWARERYFVQRTLQALGHDDLLDELDSDASWPRLEALAPRIGTRLRGDG